MHGIETLLRRVRPGAMAMATAAVGLIASIDAARAQTLEEALAMAYEANPRLLAARAELRSVDEQIAQALGGWRPTISANGSLGYARTETNVSPWESTNPDSYGADISQPLYTGGRTQAEVSQAENVIAAQRASLAGVEQQVLLEAVTAYLDVLLAREVVELSIANEQRLQRQLDATQDRFEIGEITQTDVHQAEARYSRAQADRITADGELRERNADFARVIGASPAELSPQGQAQGMPLNLEEALAVAAQENPLIVQAVASEQAARDNVDAELGDLLPQLSLVASYDHNDDVSAGVSWQNEFSIVAQLTVPLYQAGIASSQVRSARQTAAQRRYEIYDAQRIVETSVINAWQGYLTASSEVTAVEAEVSANTFARDGTESQAAIGERTVLDVLDAEQDLFRSQVRLATAQREAVAASYQLLAAMGRLSATSLGLPVELYDSDAYYQEARDSWWGLGASDDD